MLNARKLKVTSHYLHGHCLCIRAHLTNYLQLKLILYEAINRMIMGN